MTDDTQTTANALTIAEAKLSEMEAHLAVARRTVEANRAKVAEISFDVENGEAASRRLAERLLNDNRRLLEDIEHIKAPAVAEAKRRAEAAREAVSKEAARGRAEQVRALGERLEGLGATIDGGFKQISASLLEFDGVRHAGGGYSPRAPLPSTRSNDVSRGGSPSCNSDAVNDRIALKSGHCPAA